MRHLMAWMIGLFLIIGSLGVTGLVSAQDYGQGKGDEQLLAQNGKHMKRMKIHGTVESISGREAVIRTSKGKLVRVMIGPESYWEYRGYHLEPGQSIYVNGYYPEDNFDWFYAGTITGSGFSFSLTNSSGMPYWIEPEQQRVAPSYIIYRDWYGPQYRYVPPPRHEEERRDPPGHDKREKSNGKGHKK